MSSDEDAEIFTAFEPVKSVTSGVHLYDFIGAATRASYKRGWERHTIAPGKEVTPKLPVKNEHYLDWIVLLEAVNRCKGIFRMAELGAGWAPWTVRAAMATRQNPDVTGLELVAVEADPTHHKWMLEHFRDNDLDPEQFHLLHGAVSPKIETLRFPVIADPDVDYGASLRTAVNAEETIELQGFTIPELLGRFTGPLDFLHVDIQGAEYDSLPPAMEHMKRHVKCIMIGTHTSDAAHDGLSQRFRDAGWREVMNLPRNRPGNTPWGEIMLNDGFLFYENPGFT